MAAFSGRRLLLVWDGERLSFSPCIGMTLRIGNSELELGGKEGSLRHKAADDTSVGHLCGPGGGVTVKEHFNLYAKR